MKNKSCNKMLNYLPRTNIAKEEIITVLYMNTLFQTERCSKSNSEIMCIADETRGGHRFLSCSCHDSLNPIVSCHIRIPY